MTAVIAPCLLFVMYNSYENQDDNPTDEANTDRCRVKSNQPGLGFYCHVIHQNGQSSSGFRMQSA